MAAASARPRGPAGCQEERALAAQGYGAVAGIDEAGRGAWAGPLIAAAVVLATPLTASAERLEGLRDSKQLSASQREAYVPAIQSAARAIGVGVMEASEVDSLGLAEAGRRAMTAAVEALALPADFLLIDAFRLPALNLPQRSIVYGDCLILSIAAASVIAKVTRDRLMHELDALEPRYGFARHKGYGTREHQDALHRFGPCPQHRASYAPLRALAAINA